MNEPKFPLGQRSPAQQGELEKTSLVQLVLERKKFLLLLESPVDIPSRLAFEEVRPSTLRSSEIPLPNRRIPCCKRVGPFRLFHSCYMSPPSPLEHLRSCRCVCHAGHPSDFGVAKLVLHSHSCLHFRFY